MRTLALVAVLAASACGGSPGSPGTGASKTYSLAPFTIQPGEEQINCYYVPSENAERYISKFTVDMNAGSHHLVVFRVDETSAWTRVRRVPLTTRGGDIALLALPDGTVLLREQDPDNPLEVTQRVMAFTPDGTSSAVWHDYDLGAVHGDSTGQLLMGPP